MYIVYSVCARGGVGESYLFLRLHGALQIRLDARFEVLDLLALEALQLAAHQAAHVVEEQPRLMDFALGVGDIGGDRRQSGVCVVLQLLCCVSTS